MASAEYYESKKWLYECMHKRIPVQIINKSGRFFNQQKGAIKDGALPYAHVKEVLDDIDGSAWALLEWQDKHGAFIYSNNYPRSYIEYFPNDNEKSVSFLESINDFF